jgi:hypothetical protein
MTTLVILQPGYLPWLGFFNQLIRSDVFVYYDDVQFDKHGWRNRNRIKSPNGPHWLTVPVLSKGKFGQTNIEVEIDNRQPWARKHIATIQQFYTKAPYTKVYLPELEEILCSGWSNLVELDLAVVELMCQWLRINKMKVRSSELGITGSQSERLIRICQHFGATNYLSGDSAMDYLDVDLFAANGISVEWQKFHHPTYQQQFGEFVPYLSALDMLLNIGEKGKGLLTGTME